MAQIVEMLFLQTQKQRLEKTFLILTQMVSETIVASDLAKLSPGLNKSCPCHSECMEAET